MSKINTGIAIKRETPLLALAIILFIFNSCGGAEGVLPRNSSINETGSSGSSSTSSGAQTRSYGTSGSGKSGGLADTFSDPMAATQQANLEQLKVKLDHDAKMQREQRSADAEKNQKYNDLKQMDAMIQMAAILAQTSIVSTVMNSMKDCQKISPANSISAELNQIFPKAAPIKPQPTEHKGLETSSTPGILGDGGSKKSEAIPTVQPALKPSSNSDSSKKNDDLPSLKSLTKFINGRSSGKNTNGDLVNK